MERILHWHEPLASQHLQTYQSELVASRDGLRYVVDVLHFDLDEIAVRRRLSCDKLSFPQRLVDRNEGKEMIQTCAELHLQSILLFPTDHFYNKQDSDKAISYRKNQDFPNQDLLT